MIFATDWLLVRLTVRLPPWAGETADKSDGLQLYGHHNPGSVIYLRQCPQRMDGGALWPTSEWSDGSWPFSRPT
jgi:hypothetical protein